MTNREILQNLIECGQSRRCGVIKKQLNDQNRPEDGHDHRGQAKKSIVIQKTSMKREN